MADDKDKPQLTQPSNSNSPTPDWPAGFVGTRAYTPPSSPPPPPPPPREPSDAHDDGHNPFEFKAARFSLLALLVFLGGNAVGDPLCIAAGDHFVKREWLETAIGFGAGIPLVATAWIFPFRADLFTPRFRESIRRHAYRWWPVAVLLAFIYVVGPEIYQRATKPIALPVLPPSGFTQQQVDERIAAAISNLNSQLAESNRQRDAARRETDALRKQIQNAPLPLPNYDEPKVFTSKTMTELRRFYKDRTALQADAFMTDEIGKWINTEGTIQFIRPDGLVFLSDGGEVTSCEFDNSWKPKLGAYRPGELMKATGKIGTGQIGGSPIYLRPCEIHD